MDHSTENKKEHVYLNRGFLRNDNTLKCYLKFGVILYYTALALIHLFLPVVVSRNEITSTTIVELIHFFSQYISGAILGISLFRHSDKFDWIEDKLNQGVYAYPWTASKQQHHIIETADKTSRFLVKLFTRMGHFGSWGLLLKNFISDPLMKHGWPMIFFGWVPFGVDSISKFLLVSALQAVSAFIIILFWVITTSTLIVSGEHLIGQLGVLNLNLRKCANPKGNQEAFSQRVNACIHHHFVIIQYFHVLQESMSIIMLWIAINSAVIMCTIGYLITDARIDLMVKVPQLVMLPVVLMFPLAYCWYGQRIHDESCETLNAVYESEWYNLSTRHRKILVMIMIKCQRPLTLTGGGVKKALLATYLEILTTSYSYFNMIKAAKSNI